MKHQLNKLQGDKGGGLLRKMGVLEANPALNGIYFIQKGLGVCVIMSVAVVQHISSLNHKSTLAKPLAMAHVQPLGDVRGTDADEQG